MKIEQLEQLIRIIEAGSMNQAAEELYIARSSLSTSMKHLEEELGDQIFYRHSSGVSLTPFGTSVYLQAQEICGRIQYLRNFSTGKEQNQLHIANMYCSMGNDAFAKLMLRHQADHLDASIEEASLNDVIRMVSDGFCEVGILTLFSDTQELTLRKLSSASIEFCEAARRQVGAVVGSKNPLYHSEAESITLREVLTYPHLENYATPTDHAWEHRVLPKDGFQGRYVVSDLGLALRLVAETDAILIDARDIEIYRGFYANSDYRFIPICDYPACTTGWIHLKSAALTPLAQEYIEIFSSVASTAS